ncbi:ER membrane protein complex subunit 10-like protein [Drosera capensis]
MALRSPHLPLLLLLLLIPHSLSFQSDELLLDDQEFGLEGGNPNPNPNLTKPKVGARRRETESDSKVQFELEHGFGESEFERAGVFSARIKSWSHGGQTLTKLRFSRDSLTDAEKEKFKELIEKDNFYKIRLPSNVLGPPGRNYTVSSVKARCLIREALDEHIVIHMEGVNILAVNYGSPGACPYPRQKKLPAKWLFNSHTTLKYSEMAPRTPVFTEEAQGENAEGELVKPPEKSFWAKYWMYILPLGLIIMNAVTQAANMPEEQAAGQPGQQQAGAAIARGAGGGTWHLNSGTVVAAGEDGSGVK